MLLTLPENDDAQRAFYQVCINALARREHSQAELRAKAPPETDEHTIVAVFARLSEKGWQSDQRFCEQFVRGKATRGDGPLKITQALRHKGVDDALIQEALATQDWGTVAQNVYEKKYTIPPDSPKERAKRQRFLAQRGFRFDEINTVINDE